MAKVLRSNNATVSTDSEGNTTISLGSSSGSSSSGSKGSSGGSSSSSKSDREKRAERTAELQSQGVDRAFAAEQALKEQQGKKGSTIKSLQNRSVSASRSEAVQRLQERGFENFSAQDIEAQKAAIERERRGQLPTSQQTIVNLETGEGRRVDTGSTIKRPSQRRQAQQSIISPESQRPQERAQVTDSTFFRTIFPVPASRSAVQGAINVGEDILRKSDKGAQTAQRFQEFTTVQEQKKAVKRVKGNFQTVGRIASGENVQFTRDTEGRIASFALNPVNIATLPLLFTGGAPVVAGGAAQAGRAAKVAQGVGSFGASTGRIVAQAQIAQTGTGIGATKLKLTNKEEKFISDPRVNQAFNIAVQDSLQVQVSEDATLAEQFGALGKGFGAELNIAFGDKKKFVDSLKAQGFSQDEINTLLKLRTAEATAEGAGLVGAAATAEAQGARLINKAFGNVFGSQAKKQGFDVGFKISTKQAVSASKGEVRKQASNQVFLQTAKLGFGEGVSQEITQSQIRGEEFDAGRALILGSIGGVAAGTFGGTITSQAIKKKGGGKGVAFVGNLLDFPVELLGDVTAKAGSKTARTVQKTPRGTIFSFVPDGDNFAIQPFGQTQPIGLTPTQTQKPEGRARGGRTPRTPSLSDMLGLTPTETRRPKPDGGSRPKPDNKRIPNIIPTQTPTQTPTQSVIPTNIPVLTPLIRSPPPFVPPFGDLRGKGAGAALGASRKQVKNELAFAFGNLDKFAFGEIARQRPKAKKPTRRKRK